MSFYSLYREVISKNLCCDCGACMLVCPAKAISLEETDLSFEPVLSKKCLGEKCAMCVAICPGARVPRSKIEMELLGRLRDNNSLEKTQGVLKKVYIGQWHDEKVLQAAGSGGVVTGLLIYALEKKLIDGAILAGPREGKPWLSQAVLATTPQEIINLAGSRYDSFPQLMGLHSVIEHNLSKIAIVGIPCRISALRKMELGGQKYKKWTDRIKFMLGLWCIGNFSRNGIEFLVEQRLGVPLEQVDTLKYRVRPFPGQLTVTTRSGGKQSMEWVSRNALSRMSGAFTLDSCQQCIDAQCDFADVSFGDPWGHPIDQEAQKSGIGFTTALVRTRKADDLIISAQKDGMFRYFKELDGRERDFLSQTGSVIAKCYGHTGFIEQRGKRGLPTRIVE
jgi:coenzyme F420 hydrogenase subunit beta